MYFIINNNAYLQDWQYRRDKTDSIYRYMLQRCIACRYMCKKYLDLDCFILFQSHMKIQIIIKLGV